MAGADIINTFNDQPATLSLGTEQLSPALEACLLGLTEGAHETFELPANSAAFGEHNPDMVQWVARSLLKKFSLQPKSVDESYAVGDVVQFPTPDGQATYAGAVQAVTPDAVQFDFNHPLAGEPVRFEVQILGIL